MNDTTENISVDAPEVTKNKKSTFGADVLKIMGGTAFGQILGIVALPVITRLFAPDAFGMLGVYGAIIGILGVIVCMRYELAIVLPKKDTDAANLYWISIGFTFIWTILTSFPVLLFSEQLASLFNTPKVAPFLWLVPIGVFIKGIHRANTHWNTRRAKFGRLATVQASNALVTTGSKLGAGFAGLTSGGSLIVASLTGTCVAAATLGGKLWKEDRGQITSGITKKRITELLKYYRNIAVFNSSSSLFNSFSQNAPLILLAFFFSPAIVGYYVLGHKLLKIPVNLLGQSVRKVFFQRASDAWNKTGNIAELTLDISSWLAIISIGAMTVIISLIAPLTTVLFGAEWEVAGVYMQWLALWVALSFITVPLSSIVTITRKEHVSLYFQVATFTLRVAALAIGGLVFKDALIAIILYSIAGMLYHATFLIWLLNEVEASLSSLLVRISYMSIGSIGVVLSSLYLQMIEAQIVFVILLSSVYVLLFATIYKNKLSKILYLT